MYVSSTVLSDVVMCPCSTSKWSRPLLPWAQVVIYKGSRLMQLPRVDANIPFATCFLVHAQYPDHAVWECDGAIKRR